MVSNHILDCAILNAIPVPNRPTCFYNILEDKLPDE